MKNALELIKNMYPDTQPYPEYLPDDLTFPLDNPTPARPVPRLDYIQERPANSDDAIVAAPGAPACRSLKRIRDDLEEAGPSLKRTLSYDDQPEDQKRLTSRTVETLQTVRPTIPNMNDPDFIKMLDDADTELAKKPVSVLNISDDEPAIADVTLSPREVMLGDCVKPLAFKHMRGDTFLSSQRLIDVLPTEDDTTRRADILTMVLLHSMMDRGLYVNEMETYDVPKPKDPLLLHHEIHPGKFNLHFEALIIHSLQRILTSHLFFTFRAHVQRGWQLHHCRRRTRHPYRRKRNQV